MVGAGFTLKTIAGLYTGEQNLERPSNVADDRNARRRLGEGKLRFSSVGDPKQPARPKVRPGGHSLRF